MKRRHRYMLNLASLCLLAFALYLNFVKKDPEDASAPSIDPNTTEPTSDKAKGSLKTLASQTSTFVLK